MKDPFVTKKALEFSIMGIDDPYTKMQVLEDTLQAQIDDLRAQVESLSGGGGGTTNELFGGAHTIQNCLDDGGAVFNVSGDLNICNFPARAVVTHPTIFTSLTTYECPEGGWKKYLKYSATKNTSCTGSSGTYLTTMYGSTTKYSRPCTGTTCTASAHGSDTVLVDQAPLTCTYTTYTAPLFGGEGTCSFNTSCVATITRLGCY